MMSVTLERYHTVEEVCERLQISDQTFRRWIKTGKRTAYKLGKEYRISPGDLDEFLKARRV